MESKSEWIMIHPVISIKQGQPYMAHSPIRIMRSLKIASVDCVWDPARPAWDGQTVASEKAEQVFIEAYELQQTLCPDVKSKPHVKTATEDKISLYEKYQTGRSEW